MPTAETDIVVEASERTSLPIIVAFMLGGAVGSLVTYYITRNKMRSEKETEINDVTDYYETKMNQICESIYADPEIEEDHPRDDLPPEDKPYPITEQEYVEDMDFGKETVVYYENDDILTDMFDRDLIIEETIGREVLSHFNEDEEDTAYARNDKLGMDYEIILEHKSFAAIMGENMGE